EPPRERRIATAIIISFRKSLYFFENLSKPGGRLNGADPPRPGRPEPPPPSPGSPPGGSAPGGASPPRAPSNPPLLNIAASLPRPPIFLSRFIAVDISWCIFRSLLISWTVVPEPFATRILRLALMI